MKLQWKKQEIATAGGEKVSVQTPLIVSASRSTDIPAFYGDWFVNRWEAGYLKWINPFNAKPLYVSFEKTRVVVFWTKNPAPMFKHLDYLDKNIPNYYFQYSLNDYDSEGFEANVPDLESRINSFKKLSDLLGKKRVIWRFDPLILTNKIDVKELLHRLKQIGDELKDYTNKLVISFVDIEIYRKVANNLKKDGVNYIEWTHNLMEDFATGVREINKDWKLEIGTCGESIDLSQYGIIHNKCIDDDLMIDLFGKDDALMEFLGVEIEQPELFGDGMPVVIKTKNLKDKGQRKDCGCIMSKDIGQYNTCPHDCNYCYANTSKDLANKNYRLHLKNPHSETIL